MLFFFLFFFFFFLFLFCLENHYTIQTFTIYVMRQSACLVFNPIMFDNYDFKLFTLVGWAWSFLSVAWPSGVQLVFFFCSGFQ